MAARAFRALLEPYDEADEEQTLRRDAAIELLGAMFVAVWHTFNRVDVWHQEWRQAHSK